MNNRLHIRPALALIGGILLALVVTPPVLAKVDGVTGTAFDLNAKAGYISLPDGNALYTWGYALGSAAMQYPGPTLIVNEGDTITVTLRNMLPASAGNVSILFPGQMVTATGGIAGGLTQEAPPDAGVMAVTYTFVADHPGTFMYHSGTEPDLQLEMGLLGTLIVRPAGFDSLNPRAYDHAESAYDREYLFLLTEMDPRIHTTVEMHGKGALAGTDYFTDYFPNYWFINGRSAPDILAAAGTNALPNQPYNCVPQIHPGEKLLMRVIGGGRDMHPYHFHGNHARTIAVDGKLLESVPGVSGPDLGYLEFTILTLPGQTKDAIFVWDGKDLGWDVYGTDDAHMAVTLVDGDGDGYDDTTHEWIADHGKPIPVVVPDITNLVAGAFYSGSPFLGSAGVLPPGEGGLNPNAGFAFMWHSHTEKELTNWGIFPGGLLAMLIVQPPSATITE
jgi:FtsP/CotA-like multicopper oxidase with cupredoxin domain